MKTDKKSPGSLLKGIQDQLSSHSESPYLDALVLLAHVSGRPKSSLLAHPSPQLSPSQAKELDQKVARLNSGIPLPYVIGSWEFFGLDFSLTPDVLIPRPETEGLVEMALNWLESHPGRRTCLEIGTGCGCIAISLSKSVPDAEIFATDISPAALQVARENAARHGVLERIHFLEGDLLSGFDQQVDLLVANLPYIPTEKLKKLAVYRSEPTLALDGGQDGLILIKQVLRQGGNYLKPGGVILLELDEDCGTAALALAKEAWPGITIQLSQDLSNQDRYLKLQT